MGTVDESATGSVNFFWSAPAPAGRGAV